MIYTGAPACAKAALNSVDKLASSPCMRITVVMYGTERATASSETVSMRNIEVQLHLVTIAALGNFDRAILSIIVEALARLPAVGCRGRARIFKSVLAS
ncbi:hypothetical protein EVAR_27090_1 [Eumeta japonica]|uniref:Uncharacterized protein n=1 Tax=Eumeta variegata TaxID=151549 RepID=A0A4C1VKU6_EUMVA|nr:hypothetical protein EVAR_27090_1 [Eumeta japonica]